MLGNRQFLQNGLYKIYLLTAWYFSLSCFFLYLFPQVLFHQAVFPCPVVLGIAFVLGLMILLLVLYVQSIDIDRLFSLSITYSILLGLTFSGFAAFTRLLEKWFQFRIPVNISGVSVLFLLTFVLLFCPLRRLIQKKVEKCCFANRLDYRTLLCDVSSRITSLLNLSDLVEFLVVELPNRLGIQCIGLMIIEEKRSRLYPEDLRFGSRLWSESKLVATLRKGTPFYHCRPVSGDEQLTKELLEIKKAGFSMVFGLQGISLFGGLLLFGPKKDGRLHSKRHLQVLRVLANQISIAVENALNYLTLSESTSQLKKVYNKLVHAQKMASLGEMTAILAHELKNPLGVIRSSAQFLVSGERDLDMSRQLLQYIIDEVDSLDLVMSNLLGLARRSPPHFEQVDLKKELQTFVDKWRYSEDHNTQIKLSLVFPEHLPVLYADFKQLRQVLLNCVLNSEEVMPNGGNIEIAVRELDNERLEILLKDDGPGIAKDDLKLVFKKFFTTKEKGVGLGLPVCRQIIRAHNGSITLHNNKNRGTTVVIHLPLRPLVALGKDREQSHALLSNTKTDD